MPKMLEVDPEVASKIQARARERDVSVRVFARVVDQKKTESEIRNGLSSQGRVRLLREWASGHKGNTPLLSDEAISRGIQRGQRGRLLGCDCFDGETGGGRNTDAKALSKYHAR